MRRVVLDPHFDLDRRAEGADGEQAAAARRREVRTAGSMDVGANPFQVLTERHQREALRTVAVGQGG